MATQLDNLKLENILLKLANSIGEHDLPIKTILNVGIRDTFQCVLINHFAVVIDATVNTMDIDTGLAPSYVHNLNLAKNIPGPGFDLVVCAQTLMYVDNPIAVIKRLLDATNKFLIVQDTIVRPRTETTKTFDGQGKYRDVNRFTSDNNSEKIDSSDKTVWDLQQTNFTTEVVYENPPKSGNYTGIWIWEK